MLPEAEMKTIFCTSYAISTVHKRDREWDSYSVFHTSHMSDSRNKR